MRQRKNGFTFIEVLVVVVIIAVLAGIMSVSFASAGKFTRDARRKKDLANIRAALELYKVENGEYPDSSTCASGGGWTWPGCVVPWIPGLDNTYMAEIPVDPKQNATGFIGNDPASQSPLRYTYNYYRPTPTTYFLLTHLENTDDPMINGEQHGFIGDAMYVLVEPK